MDDRVSAELKRKSLSIFVCWRLIASTVRLPKPKRKELAEAEKVVQRIGSSTRIDRVDFEFVDRQWTFACLEAANQKNDEDDENENVEEQEKDEILESVSDEGIEDVDTASTTTYNDYLVSTVSRVDLDLISQFHFHVDRTK